MSTFLTPWVALRRVGDGRARTWSLLLLVALPAHAGQEPMGTLFFSAAERTALVAARSGEKPGVSNRGTSVSLNGLVKRGDLKSTVWINGQAVAEGQAVAAGIPLIADKIVTIDGQSVRVRETLDLESGARSDVLPQGAVSVRRQK